jgi:hypothetical protein
MNSLLSLKFHFNSRNTKPEFLFKLYYSYLKNFPWVSIGCPHFLINKPYN